MLSPPPSEFFREETNCVWVSLGDTWHHGCCKHHKRSIFFFLTNIGPFPQEKDKLQPSSLKKLIYHFGFINKVQVEEESLSLCNWL